MKRLLMITGLLGALCLVIVGCDSMTGSSDTDLSSSITLDQRVAALNRAAWGQSIITPPGGLENISFWENSLSFWPYTGENFSGAPQDPINVIFFGQADPRQIRAALLSLDGDRTAFGIDDVPPFNATWEDAIGDVQTGYGADEGWTGGAVQLACGDYGPARFHLRLFRMGAWTVGNVHFEVQVGSTTAHQVLSWELAESIVTVDMIRSGLLGDLPAETHEINQPDFRTIPAMIYNMLPVEVRYAIEGPLGDVSDDVPIKGNGHASVFYLVGAEPVEPGVRVLDLVINFDETIPKPFCASSPYDWLYVNGPVYLYQTNEITEGGKFVMNFHAEANLSVTPIDMSTGQPSGEPIDAVIKEHHKAQLDDYSCSASSSLFQKLVPTSSPDAGWLFKRLRVGSNGVNNFEERIKCGDDEPAFASDR